MPRYPAVERCRPLPREDAVTVIAVPMGPPHSSMATVWRCRDCTPRVPVYFIEHPQATFSRGVAGYTRPTDGDYPDNAQRFAFFAKAAMEASRALDLQPDLHALPRLADRTHPGVPANDVVATMRTFASVSSLLTIHNLAYQGLFPPQT